MKTQTRWWMQELKSSRLRTFDVGSIEWAVSIKMLRIDLVKLFQGFIELRLSLNGQHGPFWMSTSKEMFVGETSPNAGIHEKNPKTSKCTSITHLQWKDPDHAPPLMPSDILLLN